MHRTGKCSQQSSIIWSVWPNGWVYVYELTGCRCESRYDHLNFRYRACFEQGVSWHSGNYRVWIHSETRTWHDKNKQLNEIVSAMQGFYFLVKFGLVLIYILKVYRKKSSSSISLRRNMLNSLLAFFFWKAFTFSSFERFLCWKSRNYSQYFSLEIFV